MTRVLLYAQDPDIRQIYLDALEELQVACDAISSFAELFKELPRHNYSGLLLDVASTIRATPSEKSLIHDLLGLYPSLRLKWDVRAGEIRTLMYGSAQNQKTSLGDFIKSHCNAFTPRPLRLSQRVEVHCNVLLSPLEDFPPQETEKSVTVNLSDGGCFLLSTGGWREGQEVWLRFLELGDPAPIRAEIRWRLEWGKIMTLPGIGLEFLQIRPGQLEEIRAWTR